MKFINIKKVSCYLIGLFLVASLSLAAASPAAFGQDYLGTKEDPFPIAASDNVAKSLGTVGRGALTLASIVNVATTIAVSLAFLFFFYNLYKYIKDVTPEGKEEAKARMGWALLAIIVITSLWGIIGYVRGAFGVGTGEDIQDDVFIPRGTFE